MKQFETRHLPVLAEFMGKGVILLLGQHLESKMQLDSFLDNIRQGCLDQGLLKEDINETLEPIQNALLMLMNSGQELK